MTTKVKTAAHTTSQQAWESLEQMVQLHTVDRPRTMEEALAQLSQTLLTSIDAFQGNHLVTAQEKLEDTLLRALSALQAFGIDAKAGLTRSIERVAQQKKAPRVFKLYNDFVEIYVGQELRGGWRLQCQADQDAAIALAQTFDASVEWPDSKQLNLFDLSSLSQKAEKRQPVPRSRQGEFLGRTSGRRPRLQVIASNS